MRTKQWCHLLSSNTSIIITEVQGHLLVGRSVCLACSCPKMKEESEYKNSLTWKNRGRKEGRGNNWALEESDRQIKRFKTIEVIHWLKKPLTVGSVGEVSQILTLLSLFSSHKAVGSQHFQYSLNLGKAVFQIYELHSHINELHDKIYPKMANEDGRILNKIL